MQANKDIKEEDVGIIPAAPDVLQVAELYLSTSEKLAEHAYAAVSLQQQMNMLAQQVAVYSLTNLYGGITTATQPA